MEFRDSQVSSQESAFLLSLNHGLRIPLSWLQDYVDLEQDPVKLAEALTISGMEVESIEHLGDNWGEFCRVGK